MCLTDVDRPSLDHPESRDEYLFALLRSVFESAVHGESICDNLIRGGHARLKGDELQLRCDGFWHAVPAGGWSAKFTRADMVPLAFYLDGVLRTSVKWELDQPRAATVVLEDCPLKSPSEGPEQPQAAAMTQAWVPHT